MRLPVATGVVGFALLGALACAGPEEAGSVSERSTERQSAGAPPTDPFAPPADASRLCGGHVTAAPSVEGEAAAHIVWEAYASPEARVTLAARYSRSLGPPTGPSERECDSWRHPAEDPRRVLEVCATDAPGPWSECPTPPPGTATIVLVSSRSSPDR
ncbi:MAG: hypothetical protein AMXMBFR36_12150 [Acidobacteriota bacterium]